MVRLGGIEAGGTKFVCVVGSGPDDIDAVERFPTTDPADTLARAIAFFQDNRPVSALGVASFGPLELRPGHPKFGFVTATPKAGWSDTDVAGPLHAALEVPIGFDTDVNGAALAEWRWGAGRGLSSLVYLTVGTGIGGGAVLGGRLVHAMIHPEMGHLPVPRQAGDDFAGSCPFHGDCLEGMASGPAIASRWGRKPENLGELAAEAVELEAGYLAAGLRAVVYVLAPERIVMGGGVAQLPRLLPKVRRRLVDSLAGYPGLPEHHATDFVVPPGLGDRSGSLGALALAELAWDER